MMKNCTAFRLHFSFAMFVFQGGMHFLFNTNHVGVTFLLQ